MLSTNTLSDVLDWAEQIAMDSGPNDKAFRNKVSETRRSLEVAVECDFDAFAPAGLDENGVEHGFGRICDQ